MLKVNGIAKNVRTPLIGIACLGDVPFFDRQSYIAVGENSCFGYLAHVKKKDSKSSLFQPNVTLDMHDLELIQDGDILRLKSNGEIEFLWKKGSSSNCLFVTSRCNCSCFMCPQPPEEDTENYDAIIMRILSLLDKKGGESVCITGGEPTLPRKQFIKYLSLLRKNHSHRRVEVLTNAQTFSDIEFARDVSLCSPRKISFCTSLHADIASIHNHVVNSGIAFKRSVYGIQNLARFGLPVEIRFVINKHNYKRIAPFANFVSRNFPFVYHVAFMGMEIVGLATKNFDDVWIDPRQCNDSLFDAMRTLERVGIASSIYNTPLCLLDERLWNYSKQSISDWKNIYPELCSKCSLKNRCCGVFSTSTHLNPNLRPKHQQ